MMLLAQHHNHLRAYEVALSWVDKAIVHTPTLHEIYLVKAKILKGLKDFVAAAGIADYVRKLDLADRYLNNKAIKYALRANLIYQAQDLIRLFLRDSADSSPHEIQTIWYELAMGRSYLRLKYYGPAMRMFKFIEKHFTEMYEDQVAHHPNCRLISTNTL
jgi:peptide alpha-N-acetyltransferase